MKRSPDALQNNGQISPELYKQYTRVVVNIDGDWKAGNVEQDAQTDNAGNLVMNVMVDGKSYPKIIEKGEEPPLIVHDAEFRAGIIDVAFNGTFDVKNPTVSPDGYVEYTVQTPDGKVYDNVPQEFLLSWKKTLELEKEIDDLENEIKKVQEDKKEALQKRRVDLQVLLQTVYDNKHLPDVDKMQDADRTSIDNIKKAIDAVHKSAQEEIDAIKQVVDQFEDISGRRRLTPEEQLAQQATPFNEHAGYHPNSDYVYEKESAADTARKEKEETKEAKDRKESIRIIKQDIDEVIREEKDAVEREKNIALEQSIQLAVTNARNAYNQVKKRYEDEVRDWEGPPNNRRGRKPLILEALRKPFSEVDEREKARREILASAGFTIPWKEKLEKRVATAYQALFKKMQFSKNNVQHAIYEEIEKRRKEIAKHVIKDVTKNNSDFVENKAEPEKSPRLHKSIEILDVVLDDWQEEYTSKEQTVDAKGKEIFDWDKERVALQERVQKLKAELEKDNKIVLQDKQKRIQYEHLLTVEEQMEDDNKKLQNLDTIPDAELTGGTHGGPFTKDVVGLNQLRLEYLRDHLDQIKQVEAALVAIDVAAEKKEEQKQITDKQKEQETSTEKHEFKGEGIDIPDYELREMLMQHLDGVKFAMELLMRGGITEKDGTLQINPALIDQMRAVFTTEPPKKDDGSPLYTSEQLRKFGIKNWDKFKTLWDSTLAERSIALLNQSLIQTLERKIAENTKWYQKLGSMKGRLGGAAVTNGVLLTVGALGAGELITILGGGEEAQVVGAVVGGTASGTGKWWSFNTFFGSEKAQEKASQKQQKLHDKKRDEIIESVLKETFTRDKHGKLVPAGGDILNGFDSFSRMLSQQLRDTTAGEESFATNEGNITLSGSDLLSFKKSIQGIETKNIDEQTRAKLAWAWVKMKNQGITLSEFQKDQDTEQTQAWYNGILDEVSGRSSLKESVIWNVGLTGAVMASPIVSKVFGAALMGRFGASIGEKLFYDSERKESVARVDTLMRDVIHNTDLLRQHKRAGLSNTFSERKKLQQDVIALKRILHGTAPMEDMAAVIYRVQTGFYQKDEPQKNIKKGQKRPPEERIDDERYVNIKSIVYEAEREHIYLEEEKQKAKLEKVFATIKKTGDLVEQQQEARKSGFKKGAKKFAYKALGAVGGAITGVVLGWVGSKVFGVGQDSAPQNTGSTGDAHEHAAALAGMETPAKGPSVSDVHPPTGHAHPTASPDVHAGGNTTTSADQHTADAGQVDHAPASPEGRETQLGTEEIGKGEGPLHAMNRLIAKNDLGLTKQQLHDLKMEGLKDMGIEQQPDGKWKWAITVLEHKNGKILEHAEVDLYKGADGKAHFRLIGEEGKTIKTLDHYRIPSHGGQEKDSAGNVNAKPDSQTQLEKSSLKPGHTKTATVDAKGQNTLDTQQELSKASEKPVGDTPLAKQQTRFDEALKTKGGVKEFQGGVRKDGNVMVEFENGDKQLYPAEMLGFSAGEHGELVIHAPIESVMPVGTASAGVAGHYAGGGDAYTFVEGGKVPDGAKFFVTPDDGIRGTSGGVSAGGSGAEHVSPPAHPEQPSNVINLADHRDTSGGGAEAGTSDSGQDADIIQFPDKSQEIAGQEPVAANDNTIKQDTPVAPTSPDTAPAVVTSQEYVDTMKGFREWMEAQTADVRLSGPSALEQYNKFIDQFSDTALQRGAQANIDQGFGEFMHQFQGDTQGMYDALKGALEHGDLGMLTPEQYVIFDGSQVSDTGQFSHIMVHPDGSHAIRLTFEGTPIYHVDPDKVFSITSDGKLSVTEGGESYYAVPEIQIGADGSPKIDFQHSGPVVDSVPMKKAG
ncbi:MAG: hypothetical protein COU32_00930 [Candidatus Magasanikbacteria bacterium CG10_big_fil_rev_8_21_14_0_10_42_10]|uniref:Uncharacterized protein n=1 Tax=Candidatus Magasanikbacteria bacterium CG10_big_fil_rev_8_21_14_0_10_42_10 TaxID=1974649 RepID=A0A2H0TWW6_9BACT|nr:MAG: hypothetical protein COU32_00930 [Candidatus Magasanikbacteria bacterium CG10_big_fil_rev_8_21_14_0_10_42_10]